MITPAQPTNPSPLKDMEKNMVLRRLANEIGSCPEYANCTGEGQRSGGQLLHWCVGGGLEEPNMNPTLLKLPKLELNIVQPILIRKLTS